MYHSALHLPGMKKSPASFRLATLLQFKSEFCFPGLEDALTWPACVPYIYTSYAFPYAPPAHSPTTAWIARSPYIHPFSSQVMCKFQRCLADQTMISMNRSMVSTVHAFDCKPGMAMARDDSGRLLCSWCKATQYSLTENAFCLPCPKVAPFCPGPKLECYL